MNAQELIQSAKLRSGHLHPYLASAIFSMRMVASTECPTMGVDINWNCYYNPETVTQWTPQEVATVIEHEVWHLLRRHHTRTPGSGPECNPSLPPEAIHVRWNLATDCEINDGLVKTPHNKLPEGCIYPSVYKLPDDELAEYYYKHLPKDVVQVCYISVDGKGGKPWGGSCADGKVRPWESGGEHLSPVEKELIAKKVAQEIKQHSQSRGTMPNGQLRWADDTLKEPIVPWTKELSSIMKGIFASLSGRSDSTYSRRNRHQSSYGKIIRPSTYRLIPNIAVVVDTSGSVSDAMLTQALTETHNILKASEGAGVHVISCDAAAYKAQRVFNRRQVEFKGGGGTDMIVGIKSALKLKPHVAVLITDGYTPYPETCPDPTIRWVTLILSPQGEKPKYGKVVVVHKDHYLTE